MTFFTLTLTILSKDICHPMLTLRAMSHNKIGKFLERLV